MSFNPLLVIAKVEKPDFYKKTGKFARADARSAVRQLLTTIIPYGILMGSLWR